MAETGAGAGRGSGSIDPGELMEGLDALRQEVGAAVERLGEQLEIERHMRENPLAVLGVALGAGFVLGGGLWPVVRPFVKAVAKGALAPSNLMAIAAAVGAMRAATQRQGDEEDLDESAPEEPQTH